MARTTIDFGIDLGTTNSSIAVLKGTSTEVFRNDRAQEITPSAVWIGRNDVIYIGTIALDKLGKKEYVEDVKIEFKRQMGTSEVYDFSSSGRKMKAEELSAEILKSLSADVQQSIGEKVTAAAIGVPSIFDLAQNKATMKAAELAGIAHCTLIQEPVAAALAYGFQSNSDRRFWLVYDIGGGTFDAAIISYRDGQIQVINHGGDPMLGGKDIDWQIVDRIVFPELQKEYKFPPNCYRGTEPWEAFFNLLKRGAEEAKICLSRTTKALIEMNIKDYSNEIGRGIDYEYNLCRTEIEPLIEPVVMKTVSICKKMLADSRLSSSDIEKIILVGGPTFTPILRDILTSELGIPLDASKNPFTVVAEGAAIFAGTQIMPKSTSKKMLAQGQCMIDLDYQPIGTESEPEIGGIVLSKDNKSFAGFTIEFIEEKRPWESGKIRLNEDGKFRTTVSAEEGRANEFIIRLRDGKGDVRKTVPDKFSYTMGATISNQILQISIGLALADGKADLLIKKGSALPARKPGTYQTTKAVKKGESATFLKVPVVQGENIGIAERNRNIGNVVVFGNKIRRDLPIGSEVEVTLEIDESQQIRATAYVPILDQDFAEVIEIGKIIPSTQELTLNYEKEKQRMEELRQKITANNISEAEQFLQETQLSQIVRELETDLIAAEVDKDARQKCQKELVNLQIALDDIEDELEWPDLVSKAEKVISYTGEIVNNVGLEPDKRRLNALVAESNNAIRAHNTEMLRLKLEELHTLISPILIEQAWFWIAWFEYLEKKNAAMTNRFLADKLLSQGNRAIREKDLDSLKAAVRQLTDLLPQEEQDEARNYGSTILKFR